MNKKVIFIIGIIIILIAIIFFVFFNPNMAKKIKIGNTSSSQEIVENILAITSYETEIEVQVTSNKNHNK